ncbi:MAG: RNA methyltransferase [Chryseolinea sp.]
MLSKAKIKFVKSLQIKKYRKQEQLFVVEGAKSVRELLNSAFETVTIVGVSAFLETIDISSNIEVFDVSESQLAQLGAFQSNDSVLAVAKMKPNHSIKVAQDEFALVLDDIRDPGNLGTIIRTADWFGIKKIIASEESADFYNSKVVTASMGSFTRVNLYYASLPEFLHGSNVRVFGSYLDGKDVHKANFGDGGLILIGNEARGISPSLEGYVTDRVTIPRIGGGESLNAAVATAIICDNLTRAS